MVFHYAQEMFEGLKAYHTEDGRVLLFRPDRNIARARNSCVRLCIPPVPEDDFMNAIKTIVSVDKDWIPTKPGTSLYIRPFIIATDEHLGVHPSLSYKFIIILSPSGAYYASGLDPVRDGKVERQDYEEVGSMNIFFKIAGKVVTPKLNGSILPGVTRQSCLDLCRHWGLPVEERRISVDELVGAARGRSPEASWGSGTAAVISPVGVLRFGDEVMEISGGGIGPLSQRLYDTVTGIQTGKLSDEFGWTVEVK